MSEDSATQLDELTRRYYLEVMGIQCWELLDKVAEAGDASSGEVETNLRGDTDTHFQSSEIQRLEMQRLDMEVEQCEKCRFHSSRTQASSTQAMSGRGKLSADVMFILLAPTAVDDESGMLCSGEANTLFAKMLAAINISIDDVYISSLFKYSVPAQHTISTSEVQHGIVHLKQLVQLIQPKLIIVLGDTAARCLLQKDLTIDALRSLVNEGVSIDNESSTVSNEARSAYQFESLPLFISYAPQELIRQPENKRKAWTDLQTIQKIIHG